MSNRIAYKVIFASSSDANHTEKELEIRNDNAINSSKNGNNNGGNNGSQNGRGWQSERFCDYPQHLILQLIDICEIKQIQILSHQSKIASKIEIWVANEARLTWKHALKVTSMRGNSGSGSSSSSSGITGGSGNNIGQYWKKIAWKRLGYLSLDKNERSNWKARELKSVYIDTKANFIKFALHESHINTINLFNQTGIIALNVLGRALGIIAPNLQLESMNRNENQSNDNIENESDSYNNNINNNSHSKQQSQRQQETALPGTNQNSDEFSSKYDAKTAEKLRELARKKQIAVEMEDYDEAKKCKLAIENLQNVALELVNLEKNKQMAVEREDYDEAKSLKLQIQRLRELSLNPIHPTLSSAAGAGAVAAAPNQWQNNRSAAVAYQQEQQIGAPNASHSNRMGINGMNGYNNDAAQNGVGLPPHSRQITNITIFIQ